MSDPKFEIRLRYPLHALLLMGAAWVFYGFVLLVTALVLLPCIPLAPVVVVLMISLGGLLSSVHEYARSVARPRERGTLASRRDAEVTQSSLAKASR